MDAGREHQLFPLFSGVGLDDADAANGFGEASGDFGVDLPALAEDRPHRPERVPHRRTERQQHDEGNQRQRPVQIEEDDDRGRGCHDAANELHQAGADEIADPFGVIHYPRHEGARLRRIEIPDRQPGDVRLDPAPHVGDRTLSSDAKNLRQRERSDRLHHRRCAGSDRERHQPFHPSFADHIVDQVLRCGGQHQSGGTVDEHQAEPEREASTPRGDQRTGFFPRRRGQLLLLRLLGARAETAGRLRRSHPAAAARPFRPCQSATHPQSHCSVVSNQ